MSRPLTDPYWATAQSEDGFFAAPMPRGLPRPLYDGLPIPFSAATSHDHERGLRARKPLLKLADNNAIAECRALQLCILCGEELEDEAAVAWDEKLGGVVDDWMHPRCARLALAHCPHLKEGAQEGTISVREGALDELRRLPRIHTDSSGVDMLAWPFGEPEGGPAEERKLVGALPLSSD